MHQGSAVATATVKTEAVTSARGAALKAQQSHHPVDDDGCLAALVLLLGTHLPLLRLLALRRFVLR